VTLIVFDLDGTLIDSRHDLADAANALIVEGGGQPLPVEAITSMVGEGAPLLVRRALKAAGLDLDVRSALARFLELYDERLLVHTRLYDGTREALDALAPRAALAILTGDAFAPDVLVSDVGMPETDGFALVREIRRLPSQRTRKLPAIAVTAYANPEDRVRALVAGFQNHIPKPVDANVLAIAIARLVASHQPSRKSEV